jgi:hypothetical protein
MCRKKKLLTMLDPEVLDRLQEIVNEKLRNGDPFTAYDITQQLRAENFWVKHDHARTEVHRLFQDGEMPGYSRYLIDKGGPVPAWEYFPALAGLAMAGAASSPFSSTHLPGHLAPSRARSYGASSAGSAASVTATGGVAVSLDRRATVCIPARFVRQAAFQPGDRVFVFIDPQHSQLVIRHAVTGSDPNGLPARRYTVDRHYNIRITRTPQLRAGLQGTRRQVMTMADELIVTAA